MLRTRFSITSRTRTIATTVISKLVLRTAFEITDALRPKKSLQCDYYTEFAKKYFLQVRSSESAILYRDTPRTSRLNSISLTEGHEPTPVL